MRINFQTKALRSFIYQQSGYIFFNVSPNHFVLSNLLGKSLELILYCVK